MTKQHATARPWTEAEDAILGTNTLVKVAAALNRPTSQIQKRMKQLGVANFGVRGVPRSAARMAEEQAVKERNKARFDRRVRDGIAVAALVVGGLSARAAAQELGIGTEAARQRLVKFIRAARHPARLGETLLSLDAWNEFAPWRVIPPPLLAEATRRMKIELETDSLDVWSEPLQVTGASCAAPTPV